MIAHYLFTLFLFGFNFFLYVNIFVFRNYTNKSIQFGTLKYPCNFFSKSLSRIEFQVHRSTYRFFRIHKKLSGAIVKFRHNL